MSIKGSCHCGAVRFEADGQPESLIECNCSHCSRKGLLIWFLPHAKFIWTAGKGKTTVYQFNKHVIDHHCCPTCGCEPFAVGKDGKGQLTVAVNARCLEEIDLSALPRHPYDGLHA